jgi:two-component system, OmpR family, sensor histidine kinase KdpD
MLLEERADTFLRMIRRAERGRLKIYLGYCPGVGKTYQMLLEGLRLREEGIDVVIGYLETHGRAEIAKLAEGLEVIPRRKTEYRGVPLEEMDLDAVLARKPQVALVDELAHTNVPGSRNPKRYQDIQDILAAGIHVISTLNVQHLESLYDTVESAVHVKVRERLPDNIVAEADQIVNVDVTTEDLLKRLKEGKIYKADRIGTAMSNFFKTSNLEKLRELTLREMASQIDLRRREAVEEEIAAAPDQIMVALSSRGPNSEMLLRYASRLAGKLNRNWYAVYVQTPSEEPTVIDAHTQRILSGTLTLAKQLGATVFTYKGEDITGTILRFAKEYRVGTIVVGTPTRKPFWKTLWRKTTVERLVHEAKGFTVVILDTRKEEPSEIKAPDEAARQPVAAPSVPVPSGAPELSGFLSSARIVIWDRPVEKDFVLRTLAEAAVAGSGEVELATVLNNIAKREEQGSTFLNEGVALPHARIGKLLHPVVAIGLTQKGVSDVSTEKPIEYVFLILSPEEAPEVQVQILGQVSRASRNRQLVQNLGLCRTPAEVLTAFRDWETSQGASPRKTGITG